MQPESLKHVFFDLDHTLWDFDRNSALAFQQLFIKHDIPLEIHQFLPVYEPINFYYWKLYREERVTKRELRHGRFNEAFGKFGLQFSEDEVEAMAHSYIEELPKNNHLFDGALEVLQYLEDRYQLHIITNGFDQVQRIKLRTSDIDRFFKTVTTSEETGVKKPNPIIFQTAMEKAQAKPQESLMIGDTFEADILGAEAVGMQTLFYNYRNEQVPARYLKVDQIPEIKSHL